MRKTFVIDAFPESARRFGPGSVVVAVDVIRATTMATTAVSAGRRCFPVDSIHAAMARARDLCDALIAGEINGQWFPGRDMDNSPAHLEKRSDIHRPLVLVSSSGTRLIMNGRGCDRLFLGCFRNSLSLGRYLISQQYEEIALIGAGSRGEFREEDQICCARIAASLADAGYVPENETTVSIVRRWARAKPIDCLVSKSIEYLRRTGQLADLHFILERVDDLDQTFILRNDEIVAVRPDT
jgi:2-phosphosulfolactate phosphatase